MMTSYAWVFLVAFLIQSVLVAWLMKTTKSILNEWRDTVDHQKIAIDLADGLSSDLDSAIEVMRRRVSGEADIASMGEWLDLNYPKKGE
jgi:hypothetical protein